MIEIREKNMCTGCGACVAACPVSCIQMKPDEEGFWYPQVDSQQCVNCGKCDNTCPVTHVVHSAGTSIAYAAKTQNGSLRRESSSGGVFSEIAQYILDQGGVVFGAAFAKDFSVEHICVDAAEHLGKLRGSKYVQSKIEQSYQQAKQHLDNGHLVLFTGTPCQIGGLYGFLGKKYDNLYTQDIICHGVPSPAVWNRYVKYREKKAHAKTSRISFRNKANGWRSYSIHFVFNNGLVYDQPIVTDPYMQSFLKDLCLRPSCYNCAFKTMHRCADLTLADFWDVQNCNPNMDDNQGTSLVVIHSEKGKRLFCAIADKLQTEPTELEKAISTNSAMLKSAPLKPERSKFIRDVLCEDFKTIEKKYLRVKFMIRLKQKAKGLLKRFLK